MPKTNSWYTNYRSIVQRLVMELAFSSYVHQSHPVLIKIPKSIIWRNRPSLEIVGCRHRRNRRQRIITFKLGITQTFYSYSNQFPIYNSISWDIRIASTPILDRWCFDTPFGYATATAIEATATF